MVIEAHILCYNELLIMPHTIRYYKQFCSKITVHDNYSTDGTPEYLQKHHPDVHISQYYTHNKLNDLAYLKIKNNCWKNSQADYVIIVDADEFLYHENMVSLLKKLINNKIILPGVHGYNMYSENIPDQDICITKQIKKGVRANNFDKQCIFDPKQIIEINYLPGAHTCKPKLNNFVENNLFLPFFKLLHYKYINREYLLQKHAIYANRLSDANKLMGFGAEYKMGINFINEVFDMAKKHATEII